MKQPSNLRLLTTLTILLCCCACHQEKDAVPLHLSSRETPKISHRLSWDKWFSFGGNDPKNHTLYPNDVDVFWDGQKIGVSDDAVEKLSAMKPDSTWEVIFDMPDSPETSSPRLLGHGTGTFLESCLFLTDWNQSGMRLRFERKGVPVKVHFLRVEGMVESNKRRASWDNPIYFFNGNECQNGETAVELMKKVSWKKGDMLLLLFPLHPKFLVFQATFGESQMQTWLDELGRVHGVEIIGVNNSFLSWGPTGRIPLPDM